MFDTLPKTFEAIKEWGWEQFQPFYDALEARELTADSVHQWLLDRTAVDSAADEILTRARIATTQNTADGDAEGYLKHLMQTLYQPLAGIGNRLDEKLLKSGLSVHGMELVFKKMQADTEIFREENLPLFIQEQQTGIEYGKVTGAQSVEWDGKEVTLVDLATNFTDPDRNRRADAFDLYAGRWLQDRSHVNEIWTRLFALRQEVASNAGFDNYRDFRWKQFRRFDYSPADNETFHKAIEETVVPAAIRARERRRERLGLDSIRPYDLDTDASGLPPMKPWTDINAFAKQATNVFSKVDPLFGRQWAAMVEGGLIDLPNRKHKGPGAYCATMPLTASPFVFMNAVNSGDDIRTLLHECGHAFHSFASMPLPYGEMRAYPIEYAEVASFGMELLGAPYVAASEGGYLSDDEAARWRIDHLESIIQFWPYMAMVDAFQLWAYKGDNEAADPAACDAKWLELKARFEPDIDYTGYEDYKATGWHRKQHIYRYAMYYIEYGLARLGAVQVWANSVRDYAGAVKSYKHGLSLGGTRTLPDLFEATGAKFAFDTPMVGGLVKMVESTIRELEG